MKPQDFINTIKSGAILNQAKHNLLASPTIAQAILESGWGSSVSGNNLFGIKWQQGCGYGYTEVGTDEVYSNVRYHLPQKFRKYNSWADSIEDHTQFLLRNSNYKNLVGVKDYKTYCKLLQQDRYATDPHYAESLIGLIEQYKLYQFDNIQAAVQSFIKLDGGGYASYQGGAPGINLIIKDYSPDVNRIFAWVDSDKGASWSFALQVPNSNYTQFKRGINKVVTKRNGGYTFSKGSTYKLTAKGYDKNGKVVATAAITIKIPQK